MKLPAKKDYPDYYEIIKKPIDINKILNRIEDGKVDIFKIEFSVNKQSPFIINLEVLTFKHQNQGCRETKSVKLYPVIY